MGRFERLAINLLAYHAIAASEKLSPDWWKITVTTAAGNTIFLTLFAIFAPLTFGVAKIAGVGGDTTTVLALIIFGVLYFRTHRAVDEVYEQNQLQISEQASEIRNNPKQGIWWVRRRLFGYVFACLFFLSATAILLAFYLHGQ